MKREIHTFCELPSGGHNREIHWSEGVKILISPRDGDSDKEAAVLAAMIADIEDAITETEVNFKAVVAELTKARAALPPPRPGRLLGTGYVRFADGKVWVLGSREKGFGAFGYWFDSWDQLFRTFDVVVTGHGVDEHGPWWSAENAKVQA